MKIPISNTLYKSENNLFKTTNLEIKHLNNLNFQKVNLKTFPSIKLLNKCFSTNHHKSYITHMFIIFNLAQLSIILMPFTELAFLLAYFLKS